jgi:hypothetical protein
LVEKILNAYADGINYYLYKTQQSNLFYYNTSSLGIRCCGQTRSIGAISMGDLNTGELKAFYSGNTDKVSYRKRKKYPNWIERICFGTSKTASGNAILYINSHKLLFQTRDTNQQ